MTKDPKMRWELKRRITNDQILQQSVINTFGFDVIALEEEKRFDKNYKKNILKTLTGRIVKLGRRRELTSMLLPQVDLELAARGALTR